jgi:hypothetical protein
MSATHPTRGPAVRVVEVDARGLPGTTGAALCQNPGAYYVNYHTTAFPNGAIRGQLQ